MTTGEVMLRDTALVNSARRYVVRCPFHFERTPSAVVELESKMRGESRRIWFCSSCGAHGTWRAPDARHPKHILLERNDA